jgi:hypothetical protein
MEKMLSTRPWQIAALMSPSDQLLMRRCSMLPLTSGDAHSPYSVGENARSVSSLVPPRAISRAYMASSDRCSAVGFSANWRLQAWHCFTNHAKMLPLRRQTHPLASYHRAQTFHRHVP